MPPSRVSVRGEPSARALASCSTAWRKERRQRESCCVRHPRCAQSGPMLAGMPRIAYDRLGSGPAVLLLHGWPQTRRMWRLVVPALAERFSVVAADLRGYGDSEPAPDPNAYDKRSMGQDMFSLLDDLGLADQRCLVVGHD